MSASAVLLWAIALVTSGTDSLTDSDTNTESYWDLFNDSDALYEAGSYAQGFYAFSSVVYTQSAQECWGTTMS